jgi:hypothetical protein
MPTEAAYYGNRAAAELMVYQYHEATSDAKEATRLDPTNAKVSVEILELL